MRRRDVARARQSLKEAGKEGVTVELVTGPISPEAVPMCTVLAKNAAEIGMTIKVRQVDTPHAVRPQIPRLEVLGREVDAAGRLPDPDDADRPQRHHHAGPPARGRPPRAAVDLREGAGHRRPGRAAAAHRADVPDPVRARRLDHPFFANVENAYKVRTSGWPKNDFSGRTFGNAHFEQVCLASG
ncbi:hypothetical protein GCM10022254_34320 [Actinomadura meridiana]|uniref:Uncharacterized protein n=1 Tax=Actinomadura meridiana TaxID=559626 RepID=A0ABP8C3B9_9ACTN